MKRKIEEMKAEIENLKKQTKSGTLNKNEPEKPSPQVSKDELNVVQPQSAAPKQAPRKEAEEAVKPTSTNAKAGPPVTLRFTSFTNPKGIVSYLSETVKLATGGAVDKDFPIENLKKNDNDFFYNYKDYAYCSQTDCYIEFDFGAGKRVYLYSYMIRTNKSSSTVCHPRSWRIVGSNDKVKWAQLDKRINDDHLKGEYKQFNFECQENKHYEYNRYRYIRYFQDDSWQSEYPHRIFLTFFELYGVIYSKNY